MRLRANFDSAVRYTIQTCLTEAEVFAILNVLTVTRSVRGPLGGVRWMEPAYWDYLFEGKVVENNWIIRRLSLTRGVYLMEKILLSDEDRGVRLDLYLESPRFLVRVIWSVAAFIVLVSVVSILIINPASLLTPLLYTSALGIGIPILSLTALRIRWRQRIEHDGRALHRALVPEHVSSNVWVKNFVARERPFRMF